MQRRKARLKKEREAKRNHVDKFQKQKTNARRAQQARHNWLIKRTRARSTESLPNYHSEVDKDDHITIPAWVLLLIIVLAFVAGGYIYRKYVSQPPTEPNGSVTTNETLALDNIASNFVLTYAGDPAQVFRLSDWRGYPVLVEFFSIRCSACTSYLSTLQAIANRYGEQVVMISISVRWPGGEQPDNLEALQQYIVKEDITWWVALDTGTAVSQNGSASSSTTEAYGIQATPTTVLINKVGQLVFKHVGATPRATLETKIQQLLG